MMPMRVTVTAEHLTLLRAMCVGWQDVEYGAPEINPKRPYGNSSVELDVAEALGWDVDRNDGLSHDQRERAAKLHSETEAVLQAVLHNVPDSLAGEYSNVDAMAPYGCWYARNTGDTP